MEEILVIIGIIIGIIGGCLFSIPSTLSEGEYISFRINNTIAKYERYYIKNIKKINDLEYQLLLKKRKV